MIGKSPKDKDHKDALIRYWVEKARESNLLKRLRTNTILGDIQQP